MLVMVREHMFLSFEEYFWSGLDLNRKVVLDAGTGLGFGVKFYLSLILNGEMNYEERLG
jgi:hypothetical protein